MNMIHTLCTGIASSSFIKLLTGHHLTGIKQPAQGEESGGLLAVQTVALLHKVWPHSDSVSLSILVSELWKHAAVNTIFTKPPDSH